MTAVVVRLGVALAAALVVSTLVFSPRLLAAQTYPQPSSPVAQASAPVAQAQSEDLSGDEFFGEAHRRQMYEQSKLSTTNAVLYNLALPGLGNLYAEQYFYGGIAMSFMVFTLVFVGYGLATNQDEFLWFGASTAAIAYTGSIVTSIQGVREYNRKLREGLKLQGAFSQDFGPSQTPWALPEAKTVGVSFRF